ncbi:MAG: hypothetical protein NZ521_03525 [Flammeovirgaceae bacterium]|nr:hypothetical protein [Flammeovirgaceae bacterium]
MISSGYSKDKIRRMLVFVDRIVNFTDEKVVKEYETQKRELLKIEKNMGIIEAIVQQSFQEGIEKGVQEGIEKGIEKGRKEGIKKGRKEGEYQKALKTAMNCLKKGLSIEDTASITELAIEEIRALAEKLKNS